MTPLTSVDCTRCNLMSFDLVSSLSLSPIGWLTFVVERQSQFSGLLYRFCVSVRTSSDSYSLISPWTIFAKCWLTAGPFLLSSLKSFAISDSTSSPLAQSSDLSALLCSVQLNQMSDLLKMFLTPWQQFFADEWPGQLVHLVAPSSVAGLSSTQVFQGCLHIAEGFGHGWFQGGERREKQITHSPNCSHVVVSPVGALPVSAVSCLVCSAEIFREKVFMFSVGPSRLLLRCFYTRGQDESSAENFAFFLRKILSLTDSSKCGICADQSDC